MQIMIIIIIIYIINKMIKKEKKITIVAVEAFGRVTSGIGLSDGQRSGDVVIKSSGDRNPRSRRCEYHSIWQNCF